MKPGNCRHGHVKAVRSSLCSSGATRLLLINAYVGVVGGSKQFSEIGQECFVEEAELQTQLSKKHKETWQLGTEINMRVATEFEKRGREI